MFPVALGAVALAAAVVALAVLVLRAGGGQGPLTTHADGTRFSQPAYIDQTISVSGPLVVENTSDKALVLDRVELVGSHVACIAVRMFCAGLRSRPRSQPPLAIRCHEAPKPCQGQPWRPTDGCGSWSEWPQGAAGTNGRKPTSFIGPAALRIAVTSESPAQCARHSRHIRRSSPATSLVPERLRDGRGSRLGDILERWPSGACLASADRG
jgi:hypothetical protein